MKNRNTIVATLIICLLFTLAACGSSSLAGKYVLSDVVDDPEGITYADLDGMYNDMDMSLSNNLYMELLEGGRFTLVLFGEIEAEGTYTRDGDTLTLNAFGTSTTATISGKKITWTYENGAKLVFEKK